MLSLAYITNRKEPKINWFVESFLKQKAEVGIGVEVIIVDFFHEERDEPFRNVLAENNFKHVSPKPNVWNGKHRLTKDNWFAPSSARSTALCCSSGSWIAYVDDLSVLMPGWLASVREAMTKDKITLGAYKKVKKLVVENGIAVSCEEFPGGIDSRWGSGRDDKPVTASGSWMFGCSLVAPVEAFLKVNGWPEYCDGLGGEDYVAGIVLANAGYEFLYDRRMLTLESEEHHYDGPQFKRMDKGASPRDKSHKALEMALKMKYFENYFGAEGIRGLRRRVLAGEPFPVCQIPAHDWWDSQELKEM